MKKPHVQALVLWPEYTYTDIVAKKILWENSKIKYTESNNQTISWLIGAAIGILPVYNSYHGIVKGNMWRVWHRAMYESDNNIHVIGWYRLLIEHALASHETDINKIHTLFSHPQGVWQCGEYISELDDVTVRQTESTAKQVAHLMPGEAVICSKRAAEEWGLNILKFPFSPPDNYTDFLVLTQKESEGKRLSIAQQLQNLQHDRALSVFDFPDRTKNALREVEDIFSEMPIQRYFSEQVPNMKGNAQRIGVFSNAVWELQEHIQYEAWLLGGTARFL